MSKAIQGINAAVGKSYPLAEGGVAVLAEPGYGWPIYVGEFLMPDWSYAMLRADELTSLEPLPVVPRT